jgi:hypothetical protein
MDVDTVEDSSEEVDAPPAAVCAYGVCLVDAATATFKLGQFEDTAARPRLRTLLAQSPPAEVSILWMSVQHSSTVVIVVQQRTAAAVHSALLLLYTVQ